MKRLAFLLASVALLCSGGLRAETESPAGKAGSAPVKMAAVQNRIVLLVDEIHAIRNFPVVLADRLGYLKDGDLTVTVMNLRYDTWHGDMLMDGRVDAIMAYWHHNVVNQSQGRPSEAIVTLGVTPGVKIMVANQSKDKYRTLADLKGSRFIAGGPNSSKSTVSNLMVLEGGYKLGDYTRLGTDGRDKNVESLRAGNADLLVASTPEGDYYEAKGVATVFADLTTVEGTKKLFGTTFPSSTVYMASERIKSHPQFAQHLANAFVRTLKYINTHSAEEIAALIPDEVIGKGKDRVAYVKVLKEAMPMFGGDGRMPVDGADKEFRVLSVSHPKYAAVKPESTYTNRFVDEALRRFQ